MINKSIAYRISIYISLAVVGVFIAFIFISYLFNRNLLKENIENKAIGVSSEIITEVQKHLVSTKEISLNISDQILYYEQNKDADLFIKELMFRYPFLKAIHINIDTTLLDFNYHNFICFRENDSVKFEQKNELTYHCSIEKKLTEQIIQTKEPGWTEPFRCSLDSDVLVSYYSPIKIYENNHEIIVGDVICELSLLDLNEIINSIKIGERGFSFLLSQKGDFITHPNKDWILNRNIFTISDKIYDVEKNNMQEIIDEQQSGTLIAYSELLDFEKSWVYYSPVKENDWILVFILPYNELFQPLYMVLLRMLFFSVLGILFIFLIVTYISNKLVEPLNIVATKLKRFSNLSEGITINTSDEAKVVSESLNYMQSWFKEYQINHNKEKKESTQQMQDLIQASEIQRSLIKTDFPAFPERNEIDFYAIYNPARIVSGDLFDYFFIDDENIVFTIGDVSGKGIPAAIFMSVSQTIIKGSATVKMARNIVNKANKELYTNNQHQFFLTLFLGVLNVKNGILNFCNAAHTSTIILKLSGEIQELPESHGLPLGLYPDKLYSDSKIIIEKGDTLFLYTDGITELQDINQKHLGIERFKEIIRQFSQESPKEMAEKIEFKLDEFRGKAKQVDDISLLILKYNP